MFPDTTSENWHSEGVFTGNPDYTSWGFNQAEYQDSLARLGGDLSAAREQAKDRVFQHLFDEPYTADAFSDLSPIQEEAFNRSLATHMAGGDVAAIGFEETGAAALSGSTEYALGMEGQQIARSAEFGFAGNLRAGTERFMSNTGRWVDGNILNEAASTNAGLFADGKLLSSFGASPVTLGAATLAIPVVAAGAIYAGNRVRKFMNSADGS